MEQVILFEHYNLSINSAVPNRVDHKQPNISNGVYKCPYGCPCTFFHESDLQLHITAFSDYPDRHMRLWNEELVRRKHDDLR